MKKLFQLLIFVFIAGSAMAQPPMRQDRFEKVHACKVAYLTDRIDLTPEQASKFWPLYKKYENDIRATRSGGSEKESHGKPQSDAAALKMIEDELDRQEQVLALKRKYKDDFLKIISPQQLIQLYRAEREFKDMLLNRLGDHRPPPPRD